jgi:NADPH2:quinone reductase
MRAAVLHETGQPLSVEDVPEPEAGEGQSVVDVKAAGINYADVLIKNGSIRSRRSCRRSSATRWRGTSAAGG